jgi:hypothetical protein
VWDRLMELSRPYSFGGRQVHDANIVATMLAHGERRLLTFNEADFRALHRWSRWSRHDADRPSGRRAQIVWGPERDHREDARLYCLASYFGHEAQRLAFSRLAWTERNLFATGARRLSAVPLPSLEEVSSWETPISRPAHGDGILRSVEKAAEHYRNFRSTIGASVKCSRRAVILMIES